MKNLLLLLLIFSISGCTSSDESEKEIPENINIRVEIKGAETPVPRIHISINGRPVKDWEYAYLPFDSEYIYDTSGDEVLQSSCNCVNNISTWAYLSDINEMTEFNLYVDGELVDSTTITDPVYSDGTINPTILEFEY